MTAPSHRARRSATGCTGDVCGSGRVLVLPVTPETTASFVAAAEAAPAEQSAIAIVTPATSLPFVPGGAPWRMLSEAVRFEAGHFGVQVTIVQPGTIRTEMTEREQRFELPEYVSLVQQYAERFTRYRRRRVPSAEQIAGEIVDLIERRGLPLRVPVGLRSERLFGRLSPSLLGRLVRSPYKW